MFEYFDFPYQKLNPQKYETYIVQEGDSLWGSSQKKNVSVEKIVEINRLSNDTIYPNQVLFIPKNRACMVTKKGDTVGMVLQMMGSMNCKDIWNLELVANQPIGKQKNMVKYMGESMPEFLANNGITAEDFLALNYGQWLTPGNLVRVSEDSE